MDYRRRPLETAYAVPFLIDRSPATNEYTLTNVGKETVDGVTFTLHGTGVMSASAPARLEVGEALVVTIVGRDLARNTILVVRWFRPDEVEYLWRVAF
jgi:hypothetical protein